MSVIWPAVNNVGAREDKAPRGLKKKRSRSSRAESRADRHGLLFSSVFVGGA